MFNLTSGKFNLIQQVTKEIFFTWYFLCFRKHISRIVRTGYDVGHRSLFSAYTIWMLDFQNLQNLQKRKYSTEQMKHTKDYPIILTNGSNLDKLHTSSSGIFLFSPDKLLPMYNDVLPNHCPKRSVLGLVTKQNNSLMNLVPYKIIMIKVRSKTFQNRNNHVKVNWLSSWGNWIAFWVLYFIINTILKSNEMNLI